MMYSTSRILLSFAMPLQIAGTSETIAILTNHTVSRLPLIITRNYDPLSSEETCYAPLTSADSNLDGKLSNEEYARFVSLLSDGAMQVESYRDLAFELQLSFVYLGCLCGDGESGNCCDGYIDITGASPNDTPTGEELAHLNVICSKTQSALNDGATSSTGSSNIEVPTVSPVPPMADSTNSPMTTRPIESPTTFTPSVDPQSRPTPFPSSSPIESHTYSPMTLSPSSNPSPSPSSSPKSVPSPAPIETPTLSPIKLPMDSPESPSIDASSPSSPLAPLSPTPNNSTTFSNAPTDSWARPQPPTSDGYTPAPASVNYFGPISTREPTLLPYQPSYAPSSVDNLNVVEGSNEEGTDGSDTANKPSSNVVIVDILFPLLVVGFAGLFVFANEKRKKDTTTKDSSIREEKWEDADEEVGVSRTPTEPNEQISCLPQSMYSVKETSRCVGGASSEDEKNVDKVDVGLELVVSDAIEANDKTCGHDSTFGVIAIIDAVGDVSLEDGVSKGLDQNVEQICESKGDAFSLRRASESTGDDVVAVAPCDVHDFSAQVADEERTDNMPKALSDSEPEENSLLPRRIPGSQSGALVLNAASLAYESSALMEANEKNRIVDKTSEPCKTPRSHVSDSVCPSVAASICPDAVVEIDEDEGELRVSRAMDSKGSVDNDETLQRYMSEYFVAVSPNNEVKEKNGALPEAGEARDVKSTGRIPLTVPDSCSGNLDANASSPNVSLVMAAPSICSERIAQGPSQDQTVECVSKGEDSLIDSVKLSSKERLLLLRERQKKDAEIIEASNNSTIDQKATTIDRNETTDAVSARNVSNEDNDTPSPSELKAPSAALALILTTDSSNNSENPATSKVNLAEPITSTSYSMVKEIEQNRQITAGANDIQAAVKAGNWTAVGATAALLADLTDDSSSDVEDMTSEHLSDLDDDYPTMDLRLIKAGESKEFEGREHERVSTLETLNDERMSQQSRASVENSALEAAAAIRVREMQIISDDDTSATTSSNSSVSGEPFSPKSFLVQAIEKGDWHAVGQAAAILGRASYYSSDSSASSSGSSTISISRRLSWDKDDRIKHVDRLIAKGDWRGIVIAAGQYQAMDEELGSKP